MSAPRTRVSAAPLDTSDDALDVQFARLREMTGEERLRLAWELTAVARSFAEAGIAARHPDETPRQRFLRLAILELGRDLAVRAYPDAASLDL
jgi:hypothetical protein